MAISIQEQYVDVSSALAFRRSEVGTMLTQLFCTTQNGPRYPEYIGTWSKETYPPLEPRHDVADPALRADTSFPNLFPEGANVEVQKLTPSELHDDS